MSNFLYIYIYIYTIYVIRHETSTVCSKKHLTSFKSRPIVCHCISYDMFSNYGKTKKQKKVTSRYYCPRDRHDTAFVLTCDGTCDVAEIYEVLRVTIDTRYNYEFCESVELSGTDLFVSARENCSEL